MADRAQEFPTKLKVAGKKAGTSYIMGGGGLGFRILEVDEREAGDCYQDGGSWLGRTNLLLILEVDDRKATTYYQVGSGQQGDVSLLPFWRKLAERCVQPCYLFRGG